MKAARSALAAALIAAAMIGAANPVGATAPGQCVEYSPLGYCVEWDVPTPGHPGGGGGSGGRPTGGVVCYWVTIPYDLSEDPTTWFEFGLSRPPEGVTVVWQSRECSDGSVRMDVRWIIPATPANLATSVRGRLLGVLPQPSVDSSPPVGTAAIVGMPVFVDVTNWTGIRTEDECAGGTCVTVTATPSLTFIPGETASSPVGCAGSGSRYDPEGDSAAAQASADGACAYKYRLRTGAQGRPSVWPGSVSVTWRVSWTASTGASGSLPAVTRATALPRAVEEVQAVVIGGETP